MFAINAATEFAAARKRGRGVRLSEEYLNWAAGVVCDRHEDGGFFHELWRGCEIFGICAERYLPYAPTFDPGLEPGRPARLSGTAVRSLGLQLHWIKEWDVATGLTERQQGMVRSTLGRGWPVLAGLRWPVRPEWTDGLLGECGPDQVFDGHSILLVGLVHDDALPGGGCFRIRNSSGPGPDGAISFAFAARYANDVAWIE